MKKEHQLIGEAVMNGFTAITRFTNMSVCDLALQDLSTLNEIYKDTLRKMNSTNVKSLDDTKKNGETIYLEKQAELIAAIYAVKKSAKEIQEQEIKERQRKEKTLNMLLKAKEMREIENIKELTLDEINEKIDGLT